MLKVLLDTNQLVSSLLSTQGRQAELVDGWRQRKFILALAPKQIDEVSEVLLRPKIAKKYPISASDREAFLELLRNEALLLPHAEAPGVCADPDDDYILGCAAAGGVDYLVTGDGGLLEIQRHHSVTIMSATDFLSMNLE